MQDIFFENYDKNFPKVQVSSCKKNIFIKQLNFLIHLYFVYLYNEKNNFFNTIYLLKVKILMQSQSMIKKLFFNRFLSFEFFFAA